MSTVRHGKWQSRGDPKPYRQQQRALNSTISITHNAAQVKEKPPRTSLSKSGAKLADSKVINGAGTLSPCNRHKGHFANRPDDLCSDVATVKDMIQMDPIHTIVRSGDNTERDRKRQVHPQFQTPTLLLFSQWKTDDI